MKELDFTTIRNEGLLLYDYERGSYVYNLQRPDGLSDIDTAGVFVEPLDWMFSIDRYPEQIKDEKGDMVWYTMRKFFNLLCKANPAIIEALLIPEKNIRFVHPAFKRIVLDNAPLFMSKTVYQTFTKYAMSQIRKARGLNKKIVNPIERRKGVLEFCYTYDDTGYGTRPMIEWLEEHGIKQEECGLSRLPNMHNVYAVFHNPKYMYRGIAHEGSDTVCLTSIPKGETPVCNMFFNVEEYSKHCREYHDYQEWLEERNPLRYENFATDDKSTQYDKKNMMHCLRLLHISEEILRTGTANLVCEGDYHDFLMDVREGKFTYEYLLEYATKYMVTVENTYNRSTLPECVDKDFVGNMFRIAYNECYPVQMIDSVKSRC